MVSNSNMGENRKVYIYTCSCFCISIHSHRRSHIAMDMCMYRFVRIALCGSDPLGLKPKSSRNAHKSLLAGSEGSG